MNNKGISSFLPIYRDVSSRTNISQKLHKKLIQLRVSVRVSEILAQTSALLGR